jgi:hypothetical protein
MTSECAENLRFVAMFIIVVALFNVTELVAFIRNDIGAAIAIFMGTGVLLLVPMLLFTIRKEDYEDDDEEITEAAKVLCQLRQVELDTANRNEQRKHAYATRSATKND